MPGHPSCSLARTTVLFLAAALVLPAGRARADDKAVIKDAQAVLQDPALKKELSPQSFKVVQYCYEHLGKKVDRGECAELVVHAFRFAQARRYPPYGLDADYVWGELVATFKPKESALAKLRPGDILQFRNAKFMTVRRFPNGATQTQTGLTPHHTAVVVTVRRQDKVVEVLQQNAGKPGATEEQKRTVQPGEFALADLKAGWVKAYRPVALPRPAVTKVTYSDPMALEMARLINQERQGKGLKALKLNGQVGAAALAVSKHLARGQPLTGEEVSEALSAVGYVDQTSRLCYGSGPALAGPVVQGMFQNQALREILLSSRMTDLGIVVQRKGREASYCVVLAVPE